MPATKPLIASGPAPRPGLLRSPSGPESGPESGPQWAASRFPFGRRVLISEDNWLIANEWQAALADAGYAVLGIAVSAAEVVELCRSERPDFVLMDIRLLGDRDGVDAAGDIRRELGIRSVFITAQDDPQTRARAAAEQPLGWIAKPVIPSKLAATLVRLGERRH